MRPLQQEGLVTAGIRGMLPVNSLTPAEVRELFRVRGVRSARGRRDHRLVRTGAAVARLREALAQLADGGGDSAARVEADLLFHLLLCQLAGNCMLVEARRYLGGQIRVAIMNGGPDNAPPMMSLDRYSPIIDAIEKGDVPAAVAVVEEHMAAAAEHFADARDAD